MPCRKFIKKIVNLKDIKNTVRNSYKCKFLLFEKIEVNGENCHPVYSFLRKNSIELTKDNQSNLIPWNFTKIFVKNGKV